MAQNNVKDTEKKRGKKDKTSSYIPLDSPIDRMHPMVKIYAIICLGVGCIIFPFISLSYIVVIFLFFVAYKAKLLKKFARFIITFAIPITIMLLFIQGLYSPKNVTIIADLGFAELGLEGVKNALKIVGGLLVFLGSFYLMTSTTYPGKLVTALQQAGMRPAASYLVLATLNVVPQIQRRIAVIQEAQTARGVEVDGSLMTRFKAFIPIIGPTVLSSLMDAQERGMTLETRGFGAKGIKPSTFVEINITPTEKIIKVILVVFLALCVGFFIFWNIYPNLGVA